MYKTKDPVSETNISEDSAQDDIVTVSFSGCGVVVYPVSFGKLTLKSFPARVVSRGIEVDILVDRSSGGMGIKRENLSTTAFILDPQWIPKSVDLVMNELFEDRDGTYFCVLENRGNQGLDISPLQITSVKI